MPIHQFTVKVSAFIGQGRIPVEINFADRLRLTIRAPWRNRIISEGAFSLGENETMGWFTRDRLGKETVPTTFIAILEEAVHSLNIIISRNPEVVGTRPFASNEATLEDFSELFEIVEDMVRTVVNFGVAQNNKIQDIIVAATV